MFFHLSDNNGSDFKWTVCIDVRIHWVRRWGYWLQNGLSCWVLLAFVASKISSCPYPGLVPHPRGPGDPWCNPWNKRHFQQGKEWSWAMHVETAGNPGVPLRCPECFLTHAMRMPSCTQALQATCPLAEGWRKGQPGDALMLRYTSLVFLCNGDKKQTYIPKL